MATAVRYIDSTSKKFYKSDFPPENETGAVEIPLRGRMRNGWASAPHWNRHSDNNGKSTRKKKKPPFPLVSKVMVMADAYRGHTVMLTQNQVMQQYNISMGFD